MMLTILNKMTQELQFYHMCEPSNDFKKCSKLIDGERRESNSQCSFTESIVTAIAVGLKGVLNSADDLPEPTLWITIRASLLEVCLRGGTTHLHLNLGM